MCDRGLKPQNCLRWLGEGAKRYFGVCGPKGCCAGAKEGCAHPLLCSTHHRFFLKKSSGLCEALGLRGIRNESPKMLISPLPLSGQITGRLRYFSGGGRRSEYLLLSESVKCRFSKCRFSAELEKLEKISVMGGSVEKQIQKALGQHFHSVAVRE